MRSRHLPVHRDSPSSRSSHSSRMEGECDLGNFTSTYWDQPLNSDRTHPHAYDLIPGIHPLTIRHLHTSRRGPTSQSPRSPDKHPQRSASTRGSLSRAYVRPLNMHIVLDRSTTHGASLHSTSHQHGHKPESRMHASIHPMDSPPFAPGSGRLFCLFRFFPPLPASSPLVSHLHNIPTWCEHVKNGRKVVSKGSRIIRGLSTHLSAPPYGPS